MKTATKKEIDELYNKIMPPDWVEECKKIQQREIREYYSKYRKLSSAKLVRQIWREKNKQHISDYGKRYYLKHKKRILKYGRERRRKNKNGT